MMPAIRPPSPRRRRTRAAASGPLSIGGLAAPALARRHGTPLYVMDGDRIEANFRRIESAFAGLDLSVLYACKANPNLRVLELIRKLGGGADCCSAGEVDLALRAGFTPERISFTGTALTGDDARALARHGIFPHFDAISQLERFIHLFPGRRAGIRVNLGEGIGMHAHCTTGGKTSKLGIPIEYVDRAVDAARKAGGTITSLHVHAGSGGLDARYFAHQARVMFALAQRLASTVTQLDLGGGIGVPHGPGERDFDLSVYAGEVRRLARAWRARHGRPLALALEPGQYLVSDAGWLLMRIIVRKETPDRTFLIADSSFNHYLGAALYETYHHFLDAAHPARAPRETVDLCGHLCNTGDTFARARRLPRLVEGDLVAMANAGDYGISRAATYNSRPIPAEVMVRHGRARLIRRRQTVEDLLLWQR